MLGAHLSSSVHGKTVFDNFEVTTLTLGMGEYRGQIILNNNFVNINRDAYINRYERFAGNDIVSASGEAKFVSVFKYNDLTYANSYYCNTNGITSSKTAVQFIATTGVSKINTSFDMGDFKMVEYGSTINLDSIKVDCRNGYEFEGWYYIDYNGTEHKVANSGSFTVNEGITLYARAIPVEQNYSTFFIAIVVLLAIALVLAVIYILYKEKIIFKNRS